MRTQKIKIFNSSGLTLNNLNCEVQKWIDDENKRQDNNHPIEIIHMHTCITNNNLYVLTIVYWG